MKHPYLLLFFIPIAFFPLLGVFPRASFYMNFLTVFLFNILVLLDMKDRRKYFFSPTCISIFYLYLNFFLGELLFYNGIYNIYPLQVEYYASWKTLPQNTFFYNVCTFLMIVSYLKAKPSSAISNKVYPYSTKYIIIGLLFLVAFVALPIYGLSLGVPFFSVGLIYLTSKIQGNKRFLIYLLIVGIVVALNPDDKRESMFLFYPLFFLEFLKIKVFRVKYFVFFISAGAVIFLSIVVMSIIRAKLSTSVFVSSDIIREYITSDVALSAIADNFEINWCYIDAFQSMEFINTDSSLISWGSSFLKPLFWLVPRDIWPDKPESTMLLFTSVFDKAAKQEGMSLPLPMASDFYWNFKYFSVIFVYVIQYWLNKIYLSIIAYFRINSVNNNVATTEFFGVFFLFVFLLLMRGCGIDMFLVYFVVFYFMLSAFRIFRSVTRFLYRN